jgi:hypothetical protein
VPPNRPLLTAVRWTGVAGTSTPDVCAGCTTSGGDAAERNREPPHRCNGRGLADREGVDVTDRTCTIDGCEARALCRSWCSMHYQRWRVHGDPSYSSPFTDRRSHAGKVCAVEGCTNPRRKRDWCSGHYAHWRRQGDADAPYRFRWADAKLCIVCGAKDWPGKGRKVCSGACRQMHQRHGTNRPASLDCVLCGTEVDLTARGKAGRTKRCDAVLCRTCRNRRGLRHGKSAAVIAVRDGHVCRLCDRPVDMGLVHPDSMSASVDHIIPRARGGTDDLDNLQLAHLTCNQKKHTRMQLP